MWAARDADRIRETLAKMESREGVRAQTYQPCAGGGDRDVMGPTDRRIDWEGMTRRRRDEDYRLIDLACDVLYGHDQRTGGLLALRGARYADILWWRYCAAAPWVDVADAVGLSVRYTQGLADDALDFLDHYGLWAAAHSDRVRGDAEE